MIIPGKTFFVAIEYIKILYNERYTPIKEDNKSGNMINTNKRFSAVYQPFVGMSPAKGNRVNTWALSSDNTWIQYTYFAPDLTDLAISAKVYKSKNSWRNN